MSDKPHMHGDGESDSGIVPAKQPNKSGAPPAEAVEGTLLTKENMDQPNQYRTQKRGSWTSRLAHVREAARKDKKLRFTALLHHVTRICFVTASSHSSVELLPEQTALRGENMEAGRKSE